MTTNNTGGIDMTFHIAGTQYLLTPVSSEEAPLQIVRATRGYRDYIYVGRVTLSEDGRVYIIAPGGACIRQYREKGLTGAASDPSLTTLDSCETEVRLPADAVVDILTCGPAWADAL